MKTPRRPHCFFALTFAARSLCLLPLLILSGAVRADKIDDYIKSEMEKQHIPGLASPRGKSLFDGKTFKGWEGETAKTWRIENGALVGGSLTETVPHNAFLATTREYKNFILRLKVKLVGSGFVNGGIQFRSQRIAEPPYEMSGYQADMGEGYWGSLYDELRRNKSLVQPDAELLKRILKPNDWNDYEIRCEGRHIRLWLNGKLTVDYTETDAAIPLSGFIAVQIHGGGKAEASYKDIVLDELPSSLAEYFPASGERWEHRAPAAVGMDAELLAKAVAFAQTQETDFPRDFSTQEKIFGRRLGPLPKERGSTNGLVIRHGYIVAEFGDTRRADPTYSAAKSFLSTLLGVAIDRGLIKSVHDPVANYVSDGGYSSEHNRKITWHQHAQQTSEWEGTLWGKPHDFIGEKEFGEGKRQPRSLREPGTYYEYNDVRVNRFSLSLLRVFQKPLPEVLKTEVMNPIGASATWKWVPYDNAIAEVNGKPMPSVSGGTRWGGGLWISTQDEARFGLLFLRQGRWGNRQILSENWIKQALTPGASNPDYGYLWWLNARDRQWPGLPKSSFAAVGFGSNTIWVDPEHDLVVVWRWHKGSGADFFRQVVAAIK